MPGAAAIEQARGLMTRLVASGTVVPLNLLGTVGEQPDFLAHSEALPYVLSLRADPDWKHAPQKSSGHKVSPLVLELWKALDKEGAVTAAEARETLGRELTEAAVLRGLSELWQSLRISPVFGDAGQPARWELLRVRHRGALETGSNTSQVTALSLLVSMYLQSVYAASSEEIEIFLSPVASRSRVREAVRGLSATRQIHTLSMDAQTYYFLENGLPEFAELAVASAPDAEPSSPSLAQKPRPRKMQATAPREAIPASDVTLPAASAPIFRRIKPAAGPGPEPRPAPRPGQRPGPRPAAAKPGSGAGWKTPARPGSPSRPAWKPAAKAPARGAPWGGKEEGTRIAGRPRPAPGSRPPSVPGQAARPYVRRGAAAPETRPARKYESKPGTRPEVRDGARPGARPAWTGAAKRESPKPWALPGRKSGSGPRPPRAGARRDAPFRPARKYGDRPNTGSAREGAPPFPPRAVRGERGPGDPSRARSAGDRAQGRTPRPPSAYGANRPLTPYRSNQGQSGPPQQGGRPSGPRPARFDRPRPDGPRPERPWSDRPRSDRPRSDRPRADRPGRPFPGTSRPGSRPPSSRPPASRPPASRPPSSRPPFPGGTDRAARPRPTSGGASSDRPRPAGYARPERKPGSSDGGKGRGDRGPRPPFVPGSRPAKSWSEPGSRPGGRPPSRPPGSGGKSGKPPAFRGRKPDRKKPGA